MSMLTVEEAIARILAGVAPLPPETVPLSAAGGRVLAEPVRATLTQPPFDACAMDGYAVRAADVAKLPATLAVIGEAAAGSGFKGRVGPGEAVRIFTGAPIPDGADAIVIQENTRAGASPPPSSRMRGSATTSGRSGGGESQPVITPPTPDPSPQGGGGPSPDRLQAAASVEIFDGKPDPEHVRPRGGDFAEGQELLSAGRVLDARAITLAAAMGHATLTVRRRPVVAILSTGDELVQPGERPGPDQIVASNSFGLAAMVAAFGGEPRVLPVARDNKASLNACLDQAAGADILVTTGGASVGDHDIVAPVMRERGMALDFWKIAIRPGKPVFFGRQDAMRVLGLPGNPVSALICGRVFAVPLMRALMGLNPDCWTRRRAVTAHDLGGNGPRAHYMRATLTDDANGGPPRLSTACSQDSSLLKPLAEANCLIVRPVKAAALPAGSEIEVLAVDF